MKLFGYQISKEVRASPEDPRVPVSATDFLTFFGVNTGNLPAITVDNALTVPAVAAAVNFLPATLASLPLHAFRVKGEASIRIKGGVQTIVNEAPNAEWTSFGWRKYFWQQVFTGGRGLSWIEREEGQTIGVWPIDPTKAEIKFDALGRRVYKFGGKTYPATDVIDVPFMLKRDQLASYSPIVIGAKAIQLCLAMNDYASNFFAGGGVPPLAMSGPLPVGADGFKRAMADVSRAIEAAKANAKPIFPMPPGYELKPVGFDPEKGQMTDARRFQIEEIARLYNLPPVFLQDLTHGTFSNTEQQDLHLVKHLVAQWAKAFEEELNLKLFGPRVSRLYVEHNLDGLMRGDFKSRIEAMATGVQSALMTPDEARALDNRPPKEHGDKLYIQGATVPLGTPAQTPAQTPAMDETGVGA